MIIFGTRGITTTPERGSFYCPQCTGNQNYNLKRVRRFFTLYFIPVIPLDKLGEYVECPSCQGTFDPAILDYDPSEENQQVEAIFFVAIKHVMIAILLADGVIDDDEVRVLQEIYKNLTDTEIPEQELREEIAMIQQDGSSAIDLVTRLAPQLNDKGKETVIQAAYSIALADGVVDDSEVQMIGEVGGALGLTQAHFNGIWAQVTQQQGQLPTA